MDKDINIGIIDVVSQLEPRDAIYGEAVSRVKIAESAFSKFYRKACIIARHEIFDTLGKQDTKVLTVAEAYEKISDNPNIKPSAKAKNFIRCNLQADYVVIICNNEQERNVGKVKAMWESNSNAIVSVLEVNRYEELFQCYSDEADIDHRLASWREIAQTYAPAFGYSFSAPPLREAEDNDITQYARRPDFKKYFAIDPKHTTKTFSTAKAFQARYRVIASWKEICDFMTYLLNYDKLCSDNGLALDEFFTIDYRTCEACNKPFSMKQLKDENQNTTAFNICPYCEHKHQIRIPINADYTPNIDRIFYSN